MKKFIAFLLIAMLVIPTAFILSASASDSLVSANKSYSVSGCGTGYINLNGQYPASYNAKLTDGIVNEKLAYGVDDPWFGFYYNVNSPDAVGTNAPDGVGTVIIDLGSVVKGIDLFKAHLVTPGVSGIGNPSSIVVSVSADGQSFTDVGTFEKTANSTDPVWISLSAAASEGRYVKFTVTLADGVFAFVDEFEVYADPDNVVTESSDDESSAAVDDSSAVVDDSSAVVDDSSAAGETSSTAPAASSTDTTSVPKTGDDGVSMIVFAIVAAVAIIGTAIVIKVRN